MTGELLAETESGLVRGRAEEGVALWRGIPFAEPAIGDLRWRAPQPHRRWQGVRDALEYGADPVQHIGKPNDAQHMSEDALTLNISRRLDSGGNAPVLIYFYGGSNAGGTSASTMFAGRPFLAAEDIVYVTANYRLGPLGFGHFDHYSNESHTLESNLGLRDQLAVLEWVQRNIAAFGGDPGRVTIAGQSAGALAVTTLLTVPRARGLFHAAIAQSSPVASIAGPERARWRAEQIVAELGADARTAAHALASAPIAAIVEAARRALAPEQEATPGILSYSSMVDGDLLPERPLDVLREGRGHPVPLLIGTTLNEGTLFAGVNRPTPPATQVRAMLTSTAVDPHERVLAAYPTFPLLTAASAIMGDFLFWGPSVESAAGHSAVAPVWMYRYDHGTPVLKRLGLMPTHGVDLMAVFGPESSDITRKASHLSRRTTMDRVVRQSQDAWLDLVTTGRELWARYTPDARATLVIDREIRIEHDPHPQRRAVWEGFDYYP